MAHRQSRATPQFAAEVRGARRVVAFDNEQYVDWVRARFGASRSLTLDQARTVLQAAQESRIYAHVVLSVVTGLRTEEARALHWAEVDLDVGTVAVLPGRAPRR